MLKTEKISGSSISVRDLTLTIFLFAFLAILSGGLIYVLFRPVESLFFTWADEIGAGNILSNIRSVTLPLLSYIPKWFLFSLPSGLWAFAYALIITHLWRDNNSIIKYFWIGSIPLLAIGYEFLQFTGILKGVFCHEDLILSVAGISLGVLLGLTLTNKKNKK